MFTSSAWAQCPANTFDKPFICPPLAEQTPGALKAIAMKWSCLTGAPACDDPTLVNETTFKFMLWRRHERASDCIWIDQCNITLRSAAIPNSMLRGEFAQLTDPDVGAGNGDPGDILFCLPAGAFGPCPGVTVDNAQPQVMTVFDAAASSWGDVTKGIVAVSVNKIIAQNGVDFARGLVVTGTGGMGLVTAPWVIIKDPTLLCEDNERTLASMIGEILTLPQITTAGNLMRPPQLGEVPGVLLTAGQCQQARDFLDTPDGQLLDPPAGPVVDPPDPVFLDTAYDGLEIDVAPEEKYLDITNAVVIDSGLAAGTVVFCAGTAAADIALEGPEGEDTPLCIIFALDCDSNEQTGDNANLVAPGLNFDGAEFVAELLVDRETEEVVPVLHAATGLGFFVNVNLEPGVFQGNSADGLIRVIPEPSYTGPTLFPFNKEFQATLSAQLFTPVLAAAGIGPDPEGRTFPVGLRFQVATSHGQGLQIVDRGAVEEGQGGGVMLDFEDQPFPEMTVPPRVGRGREVQISVADMPPRMGLSVLVGAFNIEQPEVTTDDTGAATFMVTIPENAPLGAVLLTVGVNDPDNAVTADGVIRIFDCAPDLDENGELTIFDFLTFQNMWQSGDGFGDYDGDGELTVFDFLAYQNDFELSCP